MAKAKPVKTPVDTSEVTPEATSEVTSAPPVKASDMPRNDSRRPVTAPETTKDKPKNTYKLPDGTVVEDY